MIQQNGCYQGQSEITGHICFLKFIKFVVEFIVAFSIIWFQRFSFPTFTRCKWLYILWIHFSAHTLNKTSTLKADRMNMHTERIHSSSLICRCNITNLYTSISWELFTHQQSIEMQLCVRSETSVLLKNGSTFTHRSEKTDANKTDHRTTMVGVLFCLPMRPFKNG